MVPIPACTDKNGNATSAMSKQPLNTAYTDGGLNCVVKTISELTDQEIQFAAGVTFGGVIEITNAIGGVDVCLANPIKDRLQRASTWPQERTRSRGCRPYSSCAHVTEWATAVTSAASGTSSSTCRASPAR